MTHAVQQVVAPSWGEHAVALVGLLAATCMVIGGTLVAIVGWILRRELSRLTSSIDTGLAGVKNAVSEVWDRIDAMSKALHAQGESLARLWGAHEARQGPCAPPDNWVPRSGIDRRSPHVIVEDCDAG